MKYTIDTGDESLEGVLERLRVDAAKKGMLNSLASHIKHYMKAMKREIDDRIMVLEHLSDNEEFRDEQAYMSMLASRLDDILLCFDELIDDLPKPETKGEGSEND
ncbi:hypothetical protein AXA88_26580 [Salmonella enterica]|nr:hypothetical protein [Salmonella enterica]EAX3609384.1 hypothetical protein [Salmonella enterica]EGW6282970.1 hypothetical protein [Salmonella enterica]EGX3935384.1 hypothetical protein [Salmonella enterica]